MGFEKPFNISTYGLVRLCAGVEIVKKAPLCTFVCVCVCAYTSMSASAAEMMSSVLDIFFMAGCVTLFSRIQFIVFNTLKHFEAVQKDGRF